MSKSVPARQSGLTSAARSARKRVVNTLEETKELLIEAKNHRYFQTLKKVNWTSYQLRPILVASVLINLLELSSPLYINIVYTSILPSGSMSSLIVLTIAVVLSMLLSGWLKSVRLILTGADGARIEHSKRLDSISHFLQLRLSDFIDLAPGRHLQRLTSINLLKDESALQSLTTAIDLAFSILFILVLFLIGGTIGIVAVVAILIYLLKAIHFARRFEILSRQKDQIELQTRTYQDRLVNASDLIRSNGLREKSLVDAEKYQENLASQRMVHNSFTGEYQAFGSLMSQITFATGVTWGAVLVIHGRLSVGALAAAILLLGKILSPWQQAMSLWNNYRRLSHSRDEYDMLMALPRESDGGDHAIKAISKVEVKDNNTTILNIKKGDSILLRDDNFGLTARQLFLQLIQFTPNPTLTLNEVTIQDINRFELRNKIAYVNPARAFFDGTILENLTGFQQRRHRRKALFWSLLCGLDQKIKELPLGYATQIGGSMSVGLSRDSQALAQLVTALSRDPEILLIDFTDCSYGKEFIDSLERILSRCRGSTTVLIGGGGLVLSKLTNIQIDLKKSLNGVSN